MRLLIGLILASSVACGPEAPPFTRRAAGITDGTEDLGHPAVGKLIFSLSGGAAQDGACTATLVGQRTVLSAAHCLVYPNTQLVLDDGQRFWASRTLVHPDYDKDRPHLRDLGLALLAEAPAVRPLPLDLRLPRAGTAVTLVGYGRTAASLNDQGVKRLAPNIIASVEPDYLTVVGSGDGLGNACHGDSGGPLLAEVAGGPALLGLLSYIVDYSSCGTTTYATRLDLFAEWLQEQAAGDLQLVDLEPPQVSFLAPTAGETVPLRLTVELEVTDNLGLAEVALLVDGREQGSVSAPPFSFSLALEPGQHQLQALAWDAAGNQGEQAIVVQAERIAQDGGCQLAGRLPQGWPLALLALLAGCWQAVSRRLLGTY